jgi:hypothetical protein
MVSLIEAFVEAALIDAVECAVGEKWLHLANNPALRMATLNRSGVAPLGSWRPMRPNSIADKRADYLTIMRTLDFGGQPQTFLFVRQGVHRSSSPRIYSV